MFDRQSKFTFVSILKLFIHLEELEKGNQIKTAPFQQHLPWPRHLALLSLGYQYGLEHAGSVPQPREDLYLDLLMKKR